MSYMYMIHILSTACPGRQTCQSTVGLSLTESALGTVHWLKIQAFHLSRDV